MGLDYKEVYVKIFDDLKVKKIRISAYWREVEKEKGKFDFSATDWMIAEAEKRNTEVILAVGRKVPRWPECHEPEWFLKLSPEERKSALKNFIKETVSRYDGSFAVKAWQIENEPYLSFGACIEYDKSFVAEEIEYTRTLTKKPIVVTDGGEFGDWFRAYKRADIFGSTLYRYVVTKGVGEWTYPIPASYFRVRQSLMKLFYGPPAGEAGEKPAVVIELQAEPWGKMQIKDMSFEEQNRLFGPKRFNDMMEYIRKTGFDTFYLWGVEWWYWQEKQGYGEMLNLAREKIKEVNKQ
jgi:hypothetical protein